MTLGGNRNTKLIYKSAEEGRYITDWSRLPKGIKLPVQTYVSSGIDSVSPTYMGLYKSDHDDYRTSGTVGVGWLKSIDGSIVKDSETGQKCAIMIKPRFPSMSPWTMLEKVLADHEYDDYVRQNGEFYSFETNQDLIPIPAAESGGELLAALSFLKACEKICRRNLGRNMSFEENNFNGRIVGNIQVSKHIKYNVVVGREDRVFCRYPVFTPDVLENRILKAALRKSHAIISSAGNRSDGIQRIYNYCKNSLKMVSCCSITKSDFNRVKVTGCNAPYKNVIKLAHTILFNEGISNLNNEETDDVRMTIPYTINMEKLFEFYVRSILKEYIDKNTDHNYYVDEYRNKDINPLTVLQEDEGLNHIYLMKTYVPDVAIYEKVNNEKKYVAVFDVKYQHITFRGKDSPVRQNTHQLLFYTLLLNVTSCGFIFPKEPGAIPENDGIQLSIQNGNRIDSPNNIKPRYTQWLIDLNNNDQNEFADRMMEFVRRINNLH